MELRSKIREIAAKERELEILKSELAQMVERDQVVTMKESK